MKGHAQRSRAEDGCQQFDVLLPQEDQSRVLLVEAWRDQAALDVHSKGPMMAKTRETLACRPQGDPLHRGLSARRAPPIEGHPLSKGTPYRRAPSLWRERARPGSCNFAVTWARRYRSCRRCHPKDLDGTRPCALLNPCDLPRK